jgi:hypothetical protein
MEFRWNAWNLASIDKHGVTPQEAEHVVRFNRHNRHRKGTWIVKGRGNSNRRLEVCFLRDPDDTIWIFHAMPCK